MHKQQPDSRSDHEPEHRDQLEGAIHQVKGKAKEVAGQITNDPDLIAGGKSEKLAGNVQEKVGQIEKVLEK